MPENLFISVHSKAIIVLMLMIFSVNSRIAEDRIISGRKADIEEFPYQVSIQLKFMSMHICGGSIIHKYIILTAAHCVVDMIDPNMVLVRTGTNLASQGGSKHNIKTWRSHEHYDKVSNAHDVALILLETPIKFSDAQKSTELATKTPPPNVMGWVTGFGKTEKSSGGQQLMAVEIPVTELEKCKRVFRPRHDITDDMLCGGGGTRDRNNKDACQGDSGGPYVVGGVQVGVVSWGVGCGTKGLPGIYSDVAVHSDWITKSKKELLEIAHSTFKLWVNDNLVSN